MMAMQDLAAKSDELEEMRNAKETAAAATAMEKKTVNKLQADIISLQSEKVNHTSVSIIPQRHSGIRLAK